MTTSALSLTPFTLADLRALLRLEQVVFPVDTYGMAEFLALYKRAPETFLVARVGETIVGYIVGYVEDGESGYIVSLVVDPPFQRQGVGRALMQAVMARLHQAGAVSVGLHVRQDNLPAIQFYERLGFTRRATVPNYYEDGGAALYMDRPLPSPS